MRLLIKAALTAATALLLLPPTTAAPNAPHSTPGTKLNAPEVFRRYGTPDEIFLDAGHNVIWSFNQPGGKRLLFQINPKGQVLQKRIIDRAWRPPVVKKTPLRVA